MDRKSELERKKQKLEEMRKRRERERRERDEKRQATTSPEPTSTGASASASARDVEGLVDQLIGGTASEGRSPSPSPAAAATIVPSPADTEVAAQAGAAPPSVTLTSPKRAITLTRSTVTQTSIPPKEIVTYSKEIQTDPIDFPESDDLLAEPVDGIETQTSATDTSQPATEEEEAEVQHALPTRELSEEERTHIMGSQDFGRFFQHASKMMQRALCETDVAIDYREDEEEGKNEVAAGAKVKLSRQFSEDRWSRRRAVTCLDWSQQHPELLVASYSNNDEAPQDPDGVVLVWNSKFNAQTPEYIFHCQSAVMSTTFTKFNPHLVLGGCYSGQIALWDIRSNKRTPVQRTPLSAQAHTHPIYCLSIVGTQNAHNLISVSTDGKMCSWSLDMLSQPQDSQELQYRTAKSVAVTSLAFPLGEVNNFTVGSEDGSVYSGCRHGSKAGIGEIFEGHTGPVTSLSSHTASGQVDFSNLFLTSSFDWTVKLWSQKHQQALYSFETSSDYVFDVQWSPVHPAVFASVDGVGHLDLWNMNTDTEVPVLSEPVDAVSALNRVRWSSTGQQVACGNADGTVYIYDVGEHFHQPRAEEWTRLKNTLQDLQVSDASSTPASGTGSTSAPY